jgi:MFS family permease
VRAALGRLFVALFFSQAGFNIYWAALPLYFAMLNFDPTLIGVLIGIAGLAELGGALLVGPAIDRLGARTLLLAGVSCYVVGSLGYLVATNAVPALVLLRLIQGFGLAAVLPSAYSFVPHLARASRQTLVFASVGAAGNVAATVFPAIGLILLQASPAMLFTVAAGLAALGGLMTLTLQPPPSSRRPFGLTFDKRWTLPLLVPVLSVIQWGVITAFLPLATTEAGTNPALLFSADAVSVIAARIPAGWIADRYGPLRLALIGVIAMALSPLVLLLPLTEPVLIVAGILNGAGAGLTLPPMLGQLSQRSDEANRGTALAYFSGSFAVGIILGSSGGGLLYAWLGFRGLLIGGAILCCLALIALLADAFTVQRRPAQVQAVAQVKT